jgi:hypothetical protein
MVVAIDLRSREYAEVQSMVLSPVMDRAWHAVLAEGEVVERIRLSTLLHTALYLR